MLTTLPLSNLDVALSFSVVQNMRLTNMQNFVSCIYVRQIPFNVMRNKQFQHELYISFLSVM